MNILIYVMTMLMLLAMMTYARLEGFRDFSAMQSLFEQYMETTERKTFNEQETKWYADKQHEKSSKNEKTPQTKSTALSTLSLSPIIKLNPKISNTNTNDNLKMQQTSVLLKKLLQQLYGQQDFYKELEQRQPGFLDDFINSLIAASQNRSKDKETLSEVADLNKLDLNNLDLNNFLYRILKKDQITSNTRPNDDADEGDTPTKENGSIIENNNSTKFKPLPTPGYRSLQDFISLKTSTGIRVYLAPREILLTVFNDPNLVENIIQTRMDIYRSINHPDSNTEEASKEFSQQYKDKRDPSIDESFLDFSVSKTNPSKYL